MNEHTTKLRIYIIVLLLLAAFAICFVSAMGFLNYRTSAIELEEKVIERTEAEMVTEIETALGFGKSFHNYYGMDENFASFSAQCPGPEPFVISAEGELLYCVRDENGEAGEELLKVLASREFSKAFPDLGSEEFTLIQSGWQKIMLTPIRQESEIVGYYGVIYTDAIFTASFSVLLRRVCLLAVSVIILVSVTLFAFSRFIRGNKWLSQHRRKSDRIMERLLSVALLSAGILLLCVLSLFLYQKDYLSRIETSVERAMKTLETKIEGVREQGVDLREVENLSDFIEKRIESMNVLRTIRVSEHITEVRRTDEESDLISFVFGSEGEDTLYLEGEISSGAVNKEMRGLILVLSSTMIILLIFVFELNYLVELLTQDRGSRKNSPGSFSEKKISTALRFTGFLCSTAEYMCVPYAAMMIRASGEALFGLSVGMTAALPLTLEGVTQMIGMLVLPRYVRKFNTRVILTASAALMVLCNLAAFLSGRTLAIVICRAAAGFAYAGFKQVSNFLITKGYVTEEGRSENISQDNAGLLAGATCGAGLGAILSASAGYAVTFVVSAMFFVFYFLLTLFVVPWASLSLRKEDAGEAEPVRIGKVLRMAFSAEMLFFIIVIAIPLNIGVMLCVTLIPAICQTNGISSIMLSYCYIANGIAGIYIGPALVSGAKKRFGLRLSIAFAFALTAAGIFILHIPPVVMMIVISSMILGFLDGFGTPLVTDHFMSLRVVRNSVDESMALIFSVVLSYILLTFAPMIAELLLLPGKGAFSPMMIGVYVYGAAAVLLLILRRKNLAGQQ